MKEIINKKKILVLNGQYLPGYKGGGPIQSCVNMIENLSNKFEFYVLTADRDFKSDVQYENIKINDWNQVGAANVFYMTPDRQTIKGFNEFFNSLDFDIMYLNGFFSPIFTIKPLILKWLGKLKGKKIILTPRGDFTGGCENKKLKKYLYIYFSKLIGLYSGLIWHATSELEEKDIRKKFKNSKIFTVPNLSAKYNPKKIILEKKQGELRLVFISRIFPKKNLKFALEILSKIKKGNIVFDIYGPMEDKSYWYECKKIIKEMPSNIRIKYNGEIEHKYIEDIFSKYHAFLFPTLGENYGHVIVESMMASCLPIISDNTPWKELEQKGIGWDIPLDKIDMYIQSIDTLVNMDNEEFNNRCNKLKQYLFQMFDNEIVIQKYIDIFNRKSEE